VGGGAARRSRPAPGGWRRAVAIVVIALADLISALAAMIPLALAFMWAAQIAIDWFGAPWPDVVDPDEKDFAWAAAFHGLIGLALALLPALAANAALRRWAGVRARWLAAAAWAALAVPWLFWLIFPQAAEAIWYWLRHL
jgi:hypothetical protein